MSIPFQYSDPVITDCIEWTHGQSMLSELYFITYFQKEVDSVVNSTITLYTYIITMIKFINGWMRRVRVMEKKLVIFEKKEKKKKKGSSL